MDRERRTEIIESFLGNRVLMHKVLFGHKHESPDPPFHEEMIGDFHSTIKNLCWIAFRGSAKSTRGEEAIVARACLREFQHCIIFGSSFDRAAERLHAIRREFEKNRYLRDIFGTLRGQPWGDDTLELSSGIVIQAMGRGQAIRGTKQEIKRPDLVFADDIEDIESVRTPESRDKVQKWFLTEVMPACDPLARIRMAANALDPECLAVKLKGPDSGFTVRTYPWVYADKENQKRAIWPGRFDLPYIEEEKKRLYSLGRGREYQMEYMCEASPPEDKPFREDMLRVMGRGKEQNYIEPITRTWQGVYGLIDPARTVNRNSATTGCAIWSWIGNRLIVWESWAKKLMPDEIVSSLFDIDHEFSPVWLAVEEDGLNEFLLQPIRQEQVKRGIMLPIKAVRAPKSKLDFIRSMQPWFNAREVIFAKELPELKSQLLGFPTGKIDAPNALAYAPRLRSGAPIYDGFGARHVAMDLRPMGARPVFLALNASRTHVTAVLLQWIDGSLRVYADWVREGEPREITSRIVSEAQLESGGSVRCIVGPQHFDSWNNVGLSQALRAIPKEISNSAKSENGRPLLAEMLTREIRGYPAVQVNQSARWTLNAFAGGYAKSVTKQGVLASYAEEGVYRLLMEGIESVVGLLSVSSDSIDGDAEAMYGFTPGGKRYRTMMPPR